MTFFSSTSARVVIIALALLSPFFFPTVITLALSLLAGLYLTPIPLFVGILRDLLYYPGFGLPYGTLWGLAISVSILFVRYVIKTRIL
jgi:hypothetical protein